MVEHRSFIDTHIHFWDLKNEYPWIENNSNNDLKQNYLIEDFIDDVTWFLKKNFKYFKVYLDKTVLVKTLKK